MRTETIIIPWVGPTLNKIWAGIHYGQRVRIAKQAHLICCSVMKGIKPFTTPVHLEFTATAGPKQRSFDCSNYAISNKLIEDSLILAGIIEDDSIKFVHSVTSLRPVRGPESLTTLRIIESTLE